MTRCSSGEIEKISFILKIARTFIDRFFFKVQLVNISSK